MLQRSQSVFLTQQAFSSVLFTPLQLLARGAKLPITFQETLALCPTYSFITAEFMEEITFAVNAKQAITSAALQSASQQSPLTAISKPISRLARNAIPKMRIWDFRLTSRA